LAYAAVVCLITWPVVTQMSTHMPGKSTDALLHYWNSWWVRQALRSGESPYWTPYLFYPNGLSLVTHNMAWFQIAFWLLLEPLVGGVTAHNLGILLTLALCGCAAYLLAQRLTGDWRAAFLGGLIYMIWPYRLSQLDHPNMLATFWVPVFFLFLIYTLRSPPARRAKRWSDPVLTGVCFALVGYARWQQLIPVTLMALVYVATNAPLWLPKERRHVLLRLLIAGAVALLLLSAPIWLLVRELGLAGPSVNVMREDTWMNSDALAYITPAPDHPLIGPLAASLFGRYYGDRAHDHNPAYLGLVATLLALLGIRFRGRESLGWVLMAAMLILLAIGPVLRIGGRALPGPTLYGLLAPLVRLMRVPERFNVFVALPVSVLAAYGAAGGLAWWDKERTAKVTTSDRLPFVARPWVGAALAVLLAALIVFESLATPVPSIDVSHIPASYAQIAAEPGDFALLNYPSRNSKDYMFEQTFHERPILRGNISRLPVDAARYIEDHPGLGFLADPHNLPPKEGDVGQLLAALAKDGIRYLVVHHARLGQEAAERWRRYLLVEPRFEDDRVWVYATSPEAGRDYVVRDLGGGQGPVHTLLSAPCLNPGDTLGLAVGWSGSGGQEIALSLVDSAGQTQQNETLDVPATRDSLAWEMYRVPLSPTLPTGPYSVRLTQDDAGETAPLTVGSIVVQPEPCTLASRPDADGLNAHFGDGLTLTEVALQQDGDLLDLTLYWHAAYRPETDYKVFVHVYDPATGIPVAQHDGMPRNWIYPTSNWWPGEVVSDPIAISLQDVPAGRYYIGIGVYDPASGERLPLVDGTGIAVGDGRLTLDQTIVVE
jgi:hypothetical protein